MSYGTRPFTAKYMADTFIAEFGRQLAERAAEHECNSTPISREREDAEHLNIEFFFSPNATFTTKYLVDTYLAPAISALLDSIFETPGKKVFGRYSDLPTTMYSHQSTVCNGQLYVSSVVSQVNNEVKVVFEIPVRAT